MEARGSKGDSEERHAAAMRSAEETLRKLHADGALSKQTAQMFSACEQARVPGVMTHGILVGSITHVVLGVMGRSVPRLLQARASLAVAAGALAASLRLNSDEFKSVCTRVVMAEPGKDAEAVRQAYARVYPESFFLLTCYEVSKEREATASQGPQLPVDPLDRARLKERSSMLMRATGGESVSIAAGSRRPVSKEDVASEFDGDGVGGGSGSGSGGAETADDFSYEQYFGSAVGNGEGDAAPFEGGGDSKRTGRSRAQPSADAASLSDDGLGGDDAAGSTADHSEVGREDFSPSFAAADRSRASQTALSPEDAYALERRRSSGRRTHPSWASEHRARIDAQRDGDEDDSGRSAEENGDEGTAFVLDDDSGVAEEGSRDDRLSVRRRRGQ